MDTQNVEKVSIFTRGSSWLKGLSSKPLAKVIEISELTKKMVKDDPRRLIHSLKFALALTLMQLLYYFQPVYNSFGVYAIWAVMTVVVVFEFSVGATLGKGINRGLATLVGGALGLGAHHLASLSGKASEPILIGLFVFLQAVISTFVRFFPKVKARYDYGMLIFILTFSLVSISGFRTYEILELVQKRLWTILIGATICVILSIFVCPVWAGVDLHKLVAHNIEKLGNFLEGIMDECRITSEAAKFSLNSILDSKSNEETLANFAAWEPGHGKFMYNHPWKQYLKIGKLTRQCAYRIEALKSHLNSEIQAPQEIRVIIHEAFSSLSSECGKALKELSWSIATMTKSSSSNSHITNLKIASNNLKSLLKTLLWKQHSSHIDLQVIPIAALLIDVVAIVEQIADAVNELSLLANFKSKEIINGDIEEGLENQNEKTFEHVNNMADIVSVSVRIDGVDKIKLQG